MREYRTMTTKPNEPHRTATGAGSGSEATQSGVNGYHSRRSASKEAAFFLPYLEPGLSLLDCGCGPGSITLDLARLVAPGEVVGIDLEPRRVSQAGQAAQDQGVLNARFREGTVYELPFAEGAFDRVFANGLLEHVDDPVRALAEMSRVTRPGGWLGVRSPDLRFNVCNPPSDFVKQIWDLMMDGRARSGGNWGIGATLRGLLHDVGLLDIAATASHEVWGTSEAIRARTEGVARWASDPNNPLVAHDAVSPEAFQRILDGYVAWGRRPDAFLTNCWCEAVGRKPA
jgi:SAM-dependent methyltransferase